jgi:hypothetical protein
MTARQEKIIEYCHGCLLAPSALRCLFLERVYVADLWNEFQGKYRTTDLTDWILPAASSVVSASLVVCRGNIRGEDLRYCMGADRLGQQYETNLFVLRFVVLSRPCS